SIGYGPDEKGRVNLNFGPLNRSGGERRLNVAITRARREAVVFTCLRPDHIDLGRTKADGARDLRLFLEYAERGAKAYSSEHAATGGGARVALLGDEVARALEARGHRVERDVGCSTYRLDVAVLHPERPGEYLLGVECDGSMYASARTARDRDRLRSSVLEG